MKSNLQLNQRKPKISKADLQIAINALCTADSVFHLKTLTKDQKTIKELIQNVWLALEAEKKNKKSSVFLNKFKITTFISESEVK